MIDSEMRRQQADFLRMIIKNIRTYTYKLLEKSEANIIAVAKGQLSFGAYR